MERGRKNAISRPRKILSQGVILQNKFYHKAKVGCKGLTEIDQTVVLWNAGDEIDEEFKVCDMEFYS